MIQGNTQKIAILGAGTMGSGLAQVFASAGHKTYLYDISQKSLDTSLIIIRSSLGTFVEMNLMIQDSVDRVIENIKPTLSLEEAISGADLIVETIIEKIQAKKELFMNIDKICVHEPIITSNTSYLNIFEVMPERRLAKTAITHWFAPPQIIPLVEVVRGEKTSNDTVDYLLALLRQSDKVPIVMEKYVPGFCVNRMLRILGREIFFQLDNGYITPENLDLAVKASIIPRAMVLGFIQKYDFTGLDLSMMNLENDSIIDPPRDNAPKSLVEKVKNGNYGVKTGKGFFDYSDRNMEDILKARDIELIKVFNSFQSLIEKRI
ncbi:MAG: 3-hydroxyacyl-CoA dehydrogenase family protein [Negativicutes bacterium]